MKYTIEGFFDTEFDRPFIRAMIKDTKRNFQENIYFMINTGSSDTFLSTRDLRAMGLYLEDLEEEQDPLFFMVTSSKTYALKDPKIIFETINGVSMELELDKLSVLKGNNKDVDLIAPSILGRNVLYNFSLLINKKEDEISLTYDNESSHKLLER